MIIAALVAVVFICSPARAIPIRVCVGFAVFLSSKRSSVGCLRFIISLAALRFIGLSYFGNVIRRIHLVVKSAVVTKDRLLNPTSFPILH